jgi:hypothetical protein
MRRGLGLVVGAIAAVTLTGCASSMNVSSYVERGLDFTVFRSYAWGPADAVPTGDPRLDKNPFFQDHMQGAVEKQLAARGLQQVDTSPDLLIHYHANITERMDVDRLHPPDVYCTVGDCRNGLRYYEAGTLVVDVIDARTNRLIWRGWAQENVEPSLEDSDRMERQINEAVSRMLERFPRGRAALDPPVAAAGR